MKNENLLELNKRSQNGLTKRSMQPENLIIYNLQPINQKWQTDITQIKCKNGKTCIAPIMNSCKEK